MAKTEKTCPVCGKRFKTLVNRQKKYCSKECKKKKTKQAWYVYKMNQSIKKDKKYQKRLSKQGGVCAVCGEKPKEGERLVLDHDHRTGKIRGLIHNKENTVLGFVDDNIELLEKMIKYLKNKKQLRKKKVI
jgi:predicted nucleic acid-binding Zn ribbon protein